MSLRVRVVLDGGAGQEFVADASRPDIGAAYPWFGSDHGFVVRLAVTDGAHPCVEGLDVEAGREASIGWRDVTVSDPDPFGVVDSVRPTATGLRAMGWAIDPSTDGPVSVAIAVDDAPARLVTADRDRPDVGADHPRAAAITASWPTSPLTAMPTSCA